MKKFKEYDKNYKIFRICNYLFSIAMLIAMLLKVIQLMINRDSFSSMTQYLGPILCVSIIYILELILRYRFSNFVLLFYNIYVLFASILGTGFSFYQNIRFYDDVLHTIFGYVGGYFGIFLLVKLSDYKKMSTIYIMIMTAFVTLGSAAVWEIIEFICDVILKTNTQGPMINGVRDITDTMQDIMDAVYGLIVFEIHFIIHRLSKKKLIIGNVIDDFFNN